MSKYIFLVGMFFVFLISCAGVSGLDDSSATVPSLGETAPEIDPAETAVPETDGADIAASETPAPEEAPVPEAAAVVAEAEPEETAAEEEPVDTEAPSAEEDSALAEAPESAAPEEAPVPEVAAVVAEAEPEETVAEEEPVDTVFEALPVEEDSTLAEVPETAAPELPPVSETAPVAPSVAEAAVPVAPPVQAMPPAPSVPPLAPPTGPVQPTVPTVPPAPSRPPSPPPSVRPAETARPEPPAYLGPAEEERPSPVVREPEAGPAPGGSLPEPPAAGIPVPRPRNTELVFSRIVRAAVGQLVEIPFRGTGWVYLGELASRRGIAYDSRRLDTEGQSFLFRIEAAGIYALQFFKQDFIRDFILNDHVQVIAGEIPETAGSFDPALDQERIKAEPRWPDSRAEAELARQGGSPAPASSGGTDAAAAETQLEGAAAAGGKAAGSSGSASVAPAAAPQIQPPASVPGAERNSRPVPGPGDRGPETPVPAVRPPVLTGETAPAVPPDAPPEWFLHRAREVFEAGKTAEAISLLDQFRERYPSGSDEAYWLYGQLYEAAGPERDILSALDYYRRLLWEYPQSSRCNDARRRIAYLERYYINIQ